MSTSEDSMNGFLHAFNAEQYTNCGRSLTPLAPHQTTQLKTSTCCVHNPYLMDRLAHHSLSTCCLGISSSWPGELTSTTFSPQPMGGACVKTMTGRPSEACSCCSNQASCVASTKTSCTLTRLLRNRTVERPRHRAGPSSAAQ